MSGTGILISFEGGEGGGKTTQIALVKEKLAQQGQEVISLREPGGTDVSEQIREVVLSAKNTGISFTAEVLLFQAARAQIYEEIVIPSLEAGKVVLMDRTRDSSVIYQGIVRGFGVEAIENLNNLSTHSTFPSATLLLDVPVEIGLARRAQTGEMNRLDKETTEFHQKVRDAYLDLAQKDTSGRWKIIDASKSLEEVQAAIFEEVQQQLKK
jgi:dTMP kinase